MLLKLAVILDGAVVQSMGPFAHCAVPAGELASQIPSWMRVACEGK